MNQLKSSINATWKQAHNLYPFGEKLSNAENCKKQCSLKNFTVKVLKHGGVTTKSGNKFNCGERRIKNKTLNKNLSGTQKNTNP